MAEMFHLPSNPTKIIATIGPACEDSDVLRAMVEAGMDVARLNLSHGDLDWHARMVRRIRQLEAELGRPVGIIADLHGPRIRVGDLPRPVELEEGQQVVLVPASATSAPEQVIPVDHEHLARDVRPGQRILLDDGMLELRVQAVEGDRVVCRVVAGGRLEAHKGVNLPDSRVTVPALTEEDLQHLHFMLAQGVDYIAQSFVQSAEDVRLLKAEIKRAGAKAHVIAKLEKPQALEELEEIAAEADAIMVARGDLGVEMPIEEVPIAQKRIIAECRRQRKPVITATQMLDSMREHPRPTRAEVTDVTNAILDGTDAVMLSGETAAGKYPVQAVEMMRRIAEQAEAYERQHRRGPEGWSEEHLGIPDAVARAAAATAERVGAKLVVAFTQSGSTARLVSKCRGCVPIVAATPDLATARRCTLYWGVSPFIVPSASTTDEMILMVERLSLDRHLLQPGDIMVITAGTPVGRPGTTNMMKVHVVGEVAEAE